MAALRALPTSASDLIFSRSQPLQSQAQPGNEKDKKKGRPVEGDEAEKEIKPKEFFWDQFLLYLATAIALLTLLDITLTFLRGGGLSCFIPSEYMNETLEATREQAIYVNTFCLESLSWGEYYPVFILIHGLFLAAPHYLWSSLFGGQFDFFFDLVRQLDRLRDTDTGEYKPKNFEIVKKLENEFPESWKLSGVYTLYIVKLISQLFIAGVSIFINVGVFPQSSFAFVFECPEDFSNTSLPRGWLLLFSVECVYPSFRVLSKIQIADYLLLSAAVLTSGYGLFWCAKRHKNALGYKQIAKFAFTSCLLPDEYVFEQFLNDPFCPRIQNDLDFLMMRLYRADSGHGQVFKDLRVEKELKVLVGRDHELLHLYRSTIKDAQEYQLFPKSNQPPSRERDIRQIFFLAGFTSNPEKEAFQHLGPKRLGNLQPLWENLQSIRGRLFGYMQFAPANGLAYGISFGTIGYPLILSRGFKEVISVNFHPFYRNKKNVCRKETFHSNYSTITYQDDIFTQSTDNLNQSDRAVDEEFTDPELQRKGKTKKTHFIAIGPIVSEAKKATVNLHIQRLNDGMYFAKDAILLAIRPLKIAHRDVTNHFCKFEPPEGLFSDKEITGKVTHKLEGARVEMQHVSGSNGIKVTCDKTECIFEFSVYQFKGEYPDFPIPPREQHERVLAQMQQQQQGPGGAPLGRPGGLPHGIPQGVMPPPPFPMGHPGGPFRGMMPSPFSMGPPGQATGSIALILPAGMLPQLSATNIEQFLAGQSAIQLSARGPGSPIKFIAQAPQSEFDSCGGDGKAKVDNRTLERSNESRCQLEQKMTASSEIEVTAEVHPRGSPPHTSGSHPEDQYPNRGACLQNGHRPRDDPIAIEPENVQEDSSCV